MRAVGFAAAPRPERKIVKQNLPLWLVLLAATVLVGCRREDIHVYTTPKERGAARTDLPEGWEQLPADQMSAVKFAVRGAEGAKAQITVTPLPPAAGKPLENVNRWRNQVGLEPVSAEDLTSQMELIQVAGHSAALFDIAGMLPATQEKTRIVAAMQNRGDTVWFFKMMGEDGLVRAQRSAFTNFVARYPLPHDHDHDAATGEPAASAPAAAPVTPAAPPAPAAPGRWPVPAGWTEVSPGPMQEAKYTLADGRAAMTLSVFGDSAGTLRANVDRWRGQIGLPPVADGELEKLAVPLDLDGVKATLVDMTTAQQRMVAVIVPRGESTWYFKLLGEPDAVAAGKNTFITFVKTTK